VGAVILDAHGNILARGYRNEDTSRKGHGSHAEVVALSKLGPRKRTVAHTIVTTLEPCSLRRRQDAISCARRIVRSGIRKVYMGCLDPGVGVRGHGAQLLQDRGVYINMFPAGLNDLVMKRNREYLDSCAKHFVHQEELPTFDLDKAPPESVAFLNREIFSRYVEGLRKDYDKEFKNSPIAWEDYFASRAMSEEILENKTLRKPEGTVFEQLATFLAISPYDKNGRDDVYRRVGSWSAKMFPKRK
jgi:pyrimidine deaminase RibD-like protein